MLWHDEQCRQAPADSTYRAMRHFLRNPQSRGILQNEGHEVLALLQISTRIAVQHLQGSKQMSAAGD